MTKRLSPAAIQALQDALSVIYWYKHDLKRFLIAALRELGLLNQVNWDQPKRQIVSDLNGILCSDQDRYLGELPLLLKTVSEFRDFSHLQRLEDGIRKVREAKEAVVRLHELVRDHDQLVDQQKKADGLRKKKGVRQLGLMLSIDGFQADGVSAHSRQRPVLLLMAGADFMAVLDARINFPELLIRKRRHASQTGAILIEFSQM